MHVKETFKFNKGQGYDPIDFIGFVEGEFTDLECGPNKSIWDRDLKITITVTWQEKKRDVSK